MKLTEHEIKTINDDTVASCNRALKDFQRTLAMLKENDYDSARDLEITIGGINNLKTKVFSESEVKIREYRAEESKKQKEKQNELRSNRIKRKNNR